MRKTIHDDHATAFGALKVYGFSRGIVGGRCKPASQRIGGSCPGWSRAANIGMTCLFPAIGIGNLVRLAMGRYAAVNR